MGVIAVSKEARVPERAHTTRAAPSAQAHTSGPDADARPSAPVEPGAGDLAMVMTLVTQLRQVFSSPSYRPPLLPEVALEVHQLSFKPDVDADRLVALLETDEMLAAQVLRVASSAMYGVWNGEPSLKQAVVRLGLKNLTEVVWQVATGLRVFRSTNYGPLMEQIRTHSAVCAHLSRLVAANRRVPAESAFLCGLLHDVGMAATLLVLADQIKGGDAIDPVLLNLVLRETHQEISGLVAHVWKLPDDVQIVLATHHTGIAAEGTGDLTAVVTIAEALSSDLGFGITIGPGDCDRSDPAVLAQAYETLGFDDEDREDLERTVGGLAGILAAEFGPQAAKPGTTATAGAPQVEHPRLDSGEHRAARSTANQPAEASGPPRPSVPAAAPQHSATRAAPQASWWIALRRLLGL
jgi:HD-like signal output (HDOD) protein